MTSDKIEVLKQTELFQGLDDGVLRAVASYAVEKRLGKDEILFLAGDQAKGLYVIASGSVRAYRTGMDGREQIIHVERAVTTIAEVPVFDAGNYPSTVAAEEPALLYFLEKNRITEACLKHPELALAATRLLAKRLRKCAELVESLSLREVGQRLAKLLLEEAALRGTRAADGVAFKQTLTHNQLAARIGTVREVVTRAVYRLQSQGLIRTSGKNVTILNEDALRSYAQIDE